MVSNIKYWNILFNVNLPIAHLFTSQSMIKDNIHLFVDISVNQYSSLPSADMNSDLSPVEQNQESTHRGMVQKLSAFLFTGGLLEPGLRGWKREQVSPVFCRSSC